MYNDPYRSSKTLFFQVCPLIQSLQGFATHLLMNTFLQKVVTLFTVQSLLHLCQILDLIPSFWFLHLALRVSYQI